MTLDMIFCMKMDVKDNKILLTTNMRPPLTVVLLIVNNHRLLPSSCTERLVLTRKGTVVLEMEMETVFAKVPVTENAAKELGGHTSWYLNQHLLQLKSLLRQHAKRSALLMSMVVRIFKVAKQLEMKIFDFLKKRLNYVLQSAVASQSVWVWLFIHGAPCSRVQAMGWKRDLVSPSFMLLKALRLKLSVVRLGWRVKKFLLQIIMRCC